MFYAAILVVSSGLCNAVWNLWAKKSLNKVVFLWSFQWVALLLYSPWAIIAWASHPIPARGWLVLLLAVAMHGIYVILLSRTYALGDLSHVYPLMRGVSPLLTPLMGVLLLGEQLTGIGWLGVGSILLGIAMLGRWKKESETPRQAIGWALAVGLAITAYTTADKVALQYVPAVTLNDISNLGNLICLTGFVVRSRAIKVEWQTNWKTIVLGGVLSPGGYLLFLLGLSMAPLARLAPMREVGIVFAALLGVRVLKEQQGVKRLAAAVCVMIGVLLLGLSG